MKEPRSRCWVITINNYKENTMKLLQELKLIRYGFAGYEIGDSGTPHIQGYIQTHKPYTRSSLQRHLVKADIRGYIAIAKGSVKDNHIYCSKDGDYKEWGEAKTQGQRTDIRTFAISNQVRRFRRV